MRNKNIVFYISNHGFGHASRNIPIIEELSLKSNVNIHVKSGLNQINFINQSLNSRISNIIFHIDNLDIGLILRGTKIVMIGLEKEVSNYISSWEERCTQEEIWLKKM